MNFEKITIKGMKQNNLKDIYLEIPKNKITVFTGVSGSGKSSIVFDTIASEAGRQLNQTYSSFIQTFLPKYVKSDFLSIENLSPAIIVDQKQIGGNSRSTLGTMTDIMSFLRPVFSKIGHPQTGPAHTFSFNDPAGMCPACDGIGRKIVPIMDKMIDWNLSLNEGALLFPSFAKDGWYWQIYEASGFFEMDKKLCDFSEEERHQLLYGERQKMKVHVMGTKESNIDYEGVIPKFNRLYVTRDLSQHSKKTQELVKEYTHFSKCDVCEGKRFNEAKLSTKINDYNIFDVGELELGDLKTFLLEINQPSVQPLIDEAVKRIDHLIGMSLDYLSLNRETSTLSGGESQRVKMMKHLSSALSGLLYIFDEPSVGLHPRDVANLNQMLRHLRDIGNTILVVEHDRDVILEADHIIDVGPGAGRYGGRITYEGDVANLLLSETSTGEHLNALPPLKEIVREPKGFFELKNCTTNNLKNIDVSIPQGVLSVISGVAGSGKSSLIFTEFLNKYPEVVLVDQKALHATRRSNMLTYTGVFDRVRMIFAKENQVEKSLFSFNSKGGCPNCKGQGVVTLDLAYLEGVELVCPECDGNRYLSEVLEMRYLGKNINDILELSVEEGIEFFTDKTILKTLNALKEVGLSYLSLGQPLDTLSGGECQRVKLASELHKTGQVYVLDEPTTGLHMSDIETFMKIIDALVDNGSTVILIEHNIEVMRQADWIVDLGPEAGHKGGEIVYSGEPKGLAGTDSITVKYLLR
ncbi:ATP-binding cassette domain-containing protein [Enterococcus sp. LJL98]